MKEKIKKNWYIIVIVILLIFGMNKCSTSCNRGHEINNLKREVSKRDSLLQNLSDTLYNKVHQIEMLELELKGANNLNKAVANERSKTDEANARAADANRKVDKLRKQNEELKKTTMKRKTGSKFASFVVFK